MIGKISGYGPAGSVGGTSKRGDVAAPGGSFSDILAAAEAGETATASSVSEAAATAALSNLLALQEISEEDVRRRKLMQRGKSLLDTLEQLRRQILAGTVSMKMLQDLSRNLSVQKQFVNDPKLVEIMDDIELRAAVELAKLEMAAKSSDLA